MTSASTSTNANTSTRAFWKYQGCGNDAVLFDARTHSDALASRDGDVSEDDVRAICHRTRGIGADVVLTISRPTPGVVAHARMRIYNSDGPEAQMCSTGVRAIAKFLRELCGVTDTLLKIQTGRGVLDVRTSTDSAGVVNSATVEMGEPIFSPAHIPVRLEGDHAIDVSMPAALRACLSGPCGGVIAERVSVVSTGNPHAIFVCRPNSIQDLPLSMLGPAIERHPLFPERVNVHFVEVLSRSHVRVRSWERGAGATLACGTGACAIVAAGASAGWLDRHARVDVPGGAFEIHWHAATNQLVLTGPIASVFSGFWPVSPAVCTPTLTRGGQTCQSQA